MINNNLDFASLINDAYYTLYNVSNSYDLSFHNVFTANYNLKKASLMHDNYTDLCSNSEDYNDTWMSLEYDSILDGDLYILKRNSSVRYSLMPTQDILNESQLSLNNLKEFYNNYHSYDIFNIFNYFDEEDL